MGVKMINNLTNTLTDHDFDLSQLVKVLNLKKAQNTEYADCIHLKVTKDDNLIVEGNLSELLLEKLLKIYGKTEVWDFSLSFDNFCVETQIFIELK